MALRHLVTRPIRRLLGYAGFDVILRTDLEKGRAFPEDFSAEDLRVINRVSPFTMVPPVRLVTLIRAVEHIVQHKIPGGILECGTWKGGCMMAVAMTLQRLGATDRELVLSDLFGGRWPMPTEHDVHRGRRVLQERLEGVPGQPETIYSIADVQANMNSVAYPTERIRYVPGDVTVTMPAHAPDRIALLRLDTDLYGSTLHELRVLFPRLSPNGILIIDDYGDWEGSRRAVNEFLTETGLPLFLFRVDACARMTIKPAI